MVTKILLMAGILSLLILAGCGSGNFLTGSTAAIPGDEEPELFYWEKDNESYPKTEEEAGNLLTGIIN